MANGLDTICVQMYPLVLDDLMFLSHVPVPVPDEGFDFELASGKDDTSGGEEVTLEEGQSVKSWPQ